MDRVDRRDAETGRQHAVEGRWRAAALDVAEDRRTRLEACPLLDLLLEPHADAAQARVAERVGLAAHRFPRALLGHRALGHDDDREEAATRAAAPDEPADLVDVERLLRDQDH